MMSLERVIDAIQRTSHLSDYQLKQQFPELFELLREGQKREFWINARLSGLSFVAVNRGLACWVNPYYYRIYESHKIR